MSAQREVSLESGCAVCHWGEGRCVTVCHRRGRRVAVSEEGGRDRSREAAARMRMKLNRTRWPLAAGETEEARAPRIF